MGTEIHVTSLWAEIPYLLTCYGVKGGSALSHSYMSMNAIHYPTYFPSPHVHNAQCRGRAPVFLWTWNSNQWDCITLVTVKYMWLLMIKTTKIIPSWKVLLHAIFQDGGRMSTLISTSFYWCPKVSLNQPNKCELETATSHYSSRRYARFHCNAALPHCYSWLLMKRWITSNSPQRECLLNMLKGHDADGSALQVIVSLVYL